MLHLFMRKRNYLIDICDDFSSKVNTNNCAESIHEKKEPIKRRIMTQLFLCTSNSKMKQSRWIGTNIVGTNVTEFDVNNN